MAEKNNKRYEIIKNLKNLLLKVKNSNNEEFDVIISEIKSYIFGEALLREYYTNKITDFRTWQAKNIDAIKELYSSIKKDLVNNEIYISSHTFDMFEGKNEKFYFDEIKLFYDKLPEEHKNIRRWFDDVIFTGITLLKFYESVLFYAIRSNNVNYIPSFNNNFQKIYENLPLNSYEYYYLDREDAILQLSQFDDIFISTFKIAAISILKDLIRITKIEIIKGEPNEKKPKLTYNSDNNTFYLNNEKFHLEPAELNVLAIACKYSNGDYKSCTTNLASTLSGINTKWKSMSKQQSQNLVSKIKLKNEVNVNENLVEIIY